MNSPLQNDYRNIVVLIDLQTIFGLKYSPWRVDYYEYVITGTCSFLNSLALHDNSNTLDIIMTRYLPPPSKHVWKEYLDMFPSIDRNPNSSDYELDSRLDGVADFKVVAATTFGKWPVIEPIVGKEPCNIFIGGVSTECCVLSTALAAVDAGHKVFIMEDLCEGTVLHNEALNIMKAFSPNITVINSNIAISKIFPSDK